MHQVIAIFLSLINSTGLQTPANSLIENFTFTDWPWVNSPHRAKHSSKCLLQVFTWFANSVSPSRKNKLFFNFLSTFLFKIIFSRWSQFYCENEHKYSENSMEVTTSGNFRNVTIQRKNLFHPRIDFKGSYVLKYF